MKLKVIQQKFRDADRNSIGLFVCFALVCLMGLVLRYKLIAAKTFDYNMFLKPWYDYLQAHGLHAFRTDFANYNTPYLVLLWLVTHLPFGPLGAIKGVSIFFDLVLAFSVALLVSHFRPKGYSKYMAFAAILFAPTVFLNSSLWGQCDAIYTSFVVLALYFCLKQRAALAWILWGVAFSFKLQAIFFLPFLLFYLFYKRWKWYLPLYAVATFCVLSILPILEGRSVGSTLSIYTSQALHPTAGVAMLAWFSPTFYQFMPNQFFAYLRTAGLMLGGAVAVATASFAFYGKRYSKEVLLQIATLSLLAIPFFLPQIHERYLFSGEIALIITAFVVPKFAIAAIAMQMVTIVTYNSYFTGANDPPQIPYPVLSLVVLLIIYFLAKNIWADINRGGDSPKRAQKSLKSSDA